MASNKYNKGKIYRLVNSVDDEVYVGSTIQSLAVRKGGHKTDAVRCPNVKVYKHLNNVGWDNVDIVLIENYACTSKEELNARERYWIEELKASLNNRIPTRTVKEYMDANKDYFQQLRKQYEEANKDKIVERKKDYYQNNKEVISNKRKQYKQNNKGKIAEQNKEYREKNKETIAVRNKEYQSTRVHCPHCNEEMNRSSVKRHIKRKHTP